MNKDNTHTFSSAFQKFLKSENLEQKFKEKQLVTYWEKIMGKTIASRTTKIFIKNKMMFVYLSSAPLKQQMTTSKESVLKLIEEELGAGVVDDVRFL